MSNNLFYKTLSIIGTLGIVVLSSTQVWTTLKKQNNSEAEISKTLSELKKAKKETLKEINLIKKEVLNELDTVRLATVNQLKNDKAYAIGEIKTIKSEAISSIKDLAGEEKKIFWLVLRLGNSGRELGGSDLAPAIEKIPMLTMEECQLQGSLLKSTKEMNAKGVRIGFECVEGIAF